MKKLYSNITMRLSTHFYKKNFGKYIEYSMRNLPCETLPQRSVLTTAKMNAQLSTNEWIDDTFTISNEITNPLDGYIIGVGFGNIFKMIDLFFLTRLPRAIICVDVQPEVILIGRIIVNKLTIAANKEYFLKSLYTVTPTEIDAVIQKEQNLEISARLKESIPYIEDLFKNVLLKIENGAYLTPSIIELFMRNFDKLQGLARNNNIGVAFIDITNVHFIEKLLNLPHYATSRNIIYLSNAIDHITSRGTNIAAINTMDILHLLENSRKNICVDTTQQSLNYKLRIGTLPPKYCIEDYPNQL